MRGICGVRRREACSWLSLGEVTVLTSETDVRVGVSGVLGAENA